MKQALISVYDKAGVDEFAHGLISLGYTIISTGGTANFLREKGIDVVDISSVTGFPEILGGRVKTIHPYIAASLLAKIDDENHVRELDKLGIKPIDLVAVNLYPFEHYLEKIACSEITKSIDDMVEYIDIGGVTLLRAAAKNFKYVVVVCDPQDYVVVLEKLRKDECDFEFRKYLASKVFEYTAYYDSLISSYFNPEILSNKCVLPLEKISDARYGENPHQKASIYKLKSFNAITSGGLSAIKVHQGKELSFNNYLDIYSAWEIVSEFDEPVCVIIKHNNPCGVGCGKEAVECFKRAFECDPLSAFGGIIGMNFEIDGACANEIIKTFFECIIAPEYSKEALDFFSSKRDLRIIEIARRPTLDIELRNISDVVLIQERDDLLFKNFDFVTNRQPNAFEVEDLNFAWKIVKHVKSNAIVLAKNKQTLGIGAGQMSRIDSLKVAIMKMKENFKDIKPPIVLASDAFFPFPDVVYEAAKCGVTAIIQPGGSIKDEESIKACNELGIAMVFTGTRHFKH